MRQAGVANTDYTIDGGSRSLGAGSAFTVAGAGTHHIQFWSVDVAGNAETAETDTIRIDNIAPTTGDSLTGTVGNDDWYTSSTVRVTLQPTDADSGVAATYYTVDGGGRLTYTGSAVTVSGEGMHALTFWSVDVAGNTEATGHASSRSTQYHRTPRDSLSGTLGNAGWYTSATVNVTLGATDAGSGIKTTFFTVDGGSTKPTPAAPSASRATATHTHVRSVDAAGNVEPPVSDSFKIDSTAPTTTDTRTGTLVGGWYTTRRSASP